MLNVMVSASHKQQTTLSRGKCRLFFGISQAHRSVIYFYGYTIPSWNWSFTIWCASNRRNLETPTLRFSVDGKHFFTQLFASDDVTIITWFPWPSFPQTQIQKWRVIVVFLNSSSVVWTENIWRVFRVKPPLRRVYPASAYISNLVPRVSLLPPLVREILGTRLLTL